jgi:TetR/AcrR family transcriptional regulator
MPVAAPERIRDAERSREAILAAAETLFADHDYDQATLADIGTAAGLSRGTPTYFFGSKERLYAEVLERVFAARQRATEAAFEPVRAWCDGPGGTDALRTALTRAANGYVDFLLGRPTFVRLIMREELSRGARMPRVPASTAMLDAFGAVRRTARSRGLAPFRVEDAVLLFVALTFTPVSYGSTFMRAVGRDLTERAGRRQQVRLAVDQMMQLIGG